MNCKSESIISSYEAESAETEKRLTSLDRGIFEIINLLRDAKSDTSEHLKQVESVTERNALLEAENQNLNNLVQQQAVTIKTLQDKIDNNEQQIRTLEADFEQVKQVNIRSQLL